ncbi:hypothetical protein [Streptomyces violaceus]|uniref:Uncharacterized protein n=1 Tax=Streptomyces violaceus TaxID=1936 RepID=A0ABY9TZN2_STRVL|nr:hypothetical protein [Streptomyces janthinus]WND15871.1 hypothetical protein RI060_00070 [Streptomyces janthinus]
MLQRIPGKFEVLVFRRRLASLPCQAPAPLFQLVGAPHQKVFLSPLRTEVEFKLLGAWAEVLSAVVGRELSALTCRVSQVRRAWRMTASAHTRTKCRAVSSPSVGWSGWNHCLSILKG